MESHDEFLGFYSASDSKSASLFKVIENSLTSLGIPLHRIKGYCFDGASNMSGSIGDVQALMKKAIPESAYVHCANHSLDLVLQDIAKEQTIVSDAMQFVKDVSTALRDSSKRQELFKSVFTKDPIKVSKLCPTRWCVRTLALKRVLDAYEEVALAMQQLSTDKSVSGDRRSVFRGLAGKARKASTYFGLLVCFKVFSVCERTAKTLQHEKLTASGALKNITILKSLIVDFRTDLEFQQLFTKTTSFQGVSMPNPK